MPTATRETKSFVRQPALKASGTGEVSAVVATFGVVDRDGDVIERTAFQDGQAVPTTWAHDWSKPIGRGTIRTTPTEAIFDGLFFLTTTAGKEAYETVKAAGDLQEWSWGFAILDATYDVVHGQNVRRIRKTEVFEVSPVLVGAGMNTRTLAIKAAPPTHRYQYVAVSDDAVDDGWPNAGKARAAREVVAWALERAGHDPSRIRVRFCRAARPGDRPDLTREREIDGLYQPSDRTIWLRADLDRSRLIDVALHEAAHAVHALHGLYSETDGWIVDDTTVEMLADRYVSATRSYQYVEARRRSAAR